MNRREVLTYLAAIPVLGPLCAGKKSKRPHTGEGHTITMPAAPDLWDAKGLFVSTNDVVAALAKWAVWQSPGIQPVGLVNAIYHFRNAWEGRDPWCGANAVDLVEEMDSGILHARISDAIHKCSTISYWGAPTKTRRVHTHQSGTGWTVNYRMKSMNNGFIDLHALARNMTQDIVLEHQVSQAMDRMNEAPHGT